MSPGTAAFDGLQGLRAADGDVVRFLQTAALDVGSEGAEGEFAVVAGADGFVDGGGAGSLQAGEEDAGLDLCAWDWGCVVEAVSGAPLMMMGAWPSVSVRFAPMASRGLRMRSIGRRESEASPMRVNSPCWGASRPEIMRIVEPELPQSSGLPGWLDPASDAGDFDDSVFFAVDFGAEGAHAGEGGSAVGAGGEVGEARGALSKSGEHAVAMADGLVAGQAQAAVNVACGADEAFFEGCVQAGSVVGASILNVSSLSERGWKASVGKFLRDNQNQAEAIFKIALLRARKQKELSMKQDAKDLTRFFVVTIQGMRAIARLYSDKNALEEVARVVLAVFR